MYNRFGVVMIQERIWRTFYEINEGFGQRQGDTMDRILVIDDENINLMMVKRILCDTYDVRTTTSGEEALLLLKEFDPTLILLDIHMPGINGFDTLLEIRKVSGMEDIPVIILTADDDVDAEVKGFELGADDFIKKPLVSAIVRRRVERSIETYRLQRDLQNEVTKQTKKAENRRKELEVLSVEIIETLATAIDAKDVYTKGHSARVAEYSAILAKKLGWDESRIEKLRYKALLHDVGKIGIPDRVLNKDGKLTDEEFSIIKNHTTIGAEILSGVSSLSNMYKVARNHHERYDGKGYPDQLKGIEIPEEARLVGIADAYDAMSSDRVYRKALPKDVIRAELIRGKGTQFDPDMLSVFLSAFEAGDLELGLNVTEEPDAGLKLGDISKVVNTIMLENNFHGAMQLNQEEMAIIYRYIQNVHARGGVEFNTVLISITWEGSILPNDLSQAMKAMEYSIIQSLRKSDLMTRISDSQYLLVLTEAFNENLQAVIERIFAGFYRNCLNVNLKPIYEIQ